MATLPAGTRTRGSVRRGSRSRSGRSPMKRKAGQEAEHVDADLGAAVQRDHLVDAWRRWPRRCRPGRGRPRRRSTPAAASGGRRPAPPARRRPAAAAARRSAPARPVTQRVEEDRQRAEGRHRLDQAGQAAGRLRRARSRTSSACTAASRAGSIAVAELDREGGVAGVAAARRRAHIRFGSHRIRSWKKYDSMAASSIIRNIGVAVLAT